MVVDLIMWTENKTSHIKPPQITKILPASFFLSCFTHSTQSVSNSNSTCGKQNDKLVSAETVKI